MKWPRRGFLPSRSGLNEGRIKFLHTIANHGDQCRLLNCKLSPCRFSGAEEEDQCQKRKESHNATEQKRRQKINEKLNELKELIPGCRDGAVDKATVLNEAVDLIRKYLAEAEAWQTRENELKRLNQALLEQNHGLILAAKKQALL